jgi:hypothetical protein
MSVSDPGEKIEWGADSEPRKNERVPSSGNRCPFTTVFTSLYSRVGKMQVFQLKNENIIQMWLLSLSRIFMGNFASKINFA